MQEFPIGSIVMYSGKDIPDGWLLCDGKNGTPDLRNRIVLGSDFSNLGKENKCEVNAENMEDVYFINTTEDASISANIKEHVLTIEEIPSHNHPITYGGNNSVEIGHRDGGSSGGDYNAIARTDHPIQRLGVGWAGSDKGHSHNIEVNAHNHKIKTKVPYYTLVFIMYSGG